MAKRSQTLTLPVPRTEAKQACERSLLALGWEVERDGDRLVGREPTDALCCSIWPVRVGIEAGADDDGRTVVELDFETPGRGLIQSRQLRDRMRSVALGIARQV